MCGLFPCFSVWPYTTDVVLFSLCHTMDFMMLRVWSTEVSKPDCSFYFFNVVDMFDRGRFSNRNIY